MGDVAKEEKNEPEEKEEVEVEEVEKKENVPVVEKEVVEETTLTTTDKPNSNEKFTKVSVGKLREVDSDDDVMTDDEEEPLKDAGDIEIQIVEDNVEDTKAKQEAEEIEAMKLWKIKKEEDAAATAAAAAAAAALE